MCTKTQEQINKYTESRYNEFGYYEYFFPQKRTFLIDINL